MVWLLSDHLWERWMLVARRLMRDGVPNDAGRLLQAANEIAGTFADDDPRRAAGLDALGTHVAIQGDNARAGKVYCEALAAWSAAQAWVAVMGTAQAARSSMFHLRLESKHAGAYPKITRARHARTCAAGQAGTQANLANLTGDHPALTAAMVARRDAFGQRESGAAAMAFALGETVKGDVIDRWQERPPQRYDDERRLYAAALLAPVLINSDTSS